jgi:Flp pilus assembly protein TadG
MTNARRRRAKTSYLHNDSGAAGVEFAFILPVLLIGAFIVVEFSRVLYSKIEFEYALFSAMRFSSVAKSSETAKVQKSLSDNLILLNPSKVSPINITVAPNADKTSTVTLTASYRVDSLLPIAAMPSITLSRSTSYLISN